jgi:hypothetical protein
VTLSSNLPIPKPSTISRYIQNGKRITEGVVRYKELETFLNTRALPDHVWLSGDATAIIARAQYDATNGEVVGLCAPLSPNGLMSSPPFN